MTIEIPMWLFWVAGIVGGLVILLLAWVGYMFLKCFSGGLY